MAALVTIRANHFWILIRRFDFIVFQMRPRGAMAILTLHIFQMRSGLQTHETCTPFEFSIRCRSIFRSLPRFKSNNMTR